MIAWLKKRIILAAPTCTLWAPNYKTQRFEFIFNKNIQISNLEYTKTHLDNMNIRYNR